MKHNYFKLLPLIIFCLVSMTGSAQNEYYDANRIKKDIKNNTISSVGAKILFKYFFIPDSVDNSDDSLSALSKAISQNPFLENFKVQTSALHGSLGVDIKKAVSGVGGLDVTNIANGISQFMIKRAREELTIAFFERFRKFAEENPEFQVLFPKTTNSLENLLSYNYPEYLPVLRVSFFEDIKATPYHLDDVLQLPRYQSLLKDLPEVKVAVRTVQSIYQLESGNMHAADLLTRLADFPEWNEASASNSFYNFGNAIKLASIFSQSLRNDSAVSKSSRAWISYSEMDSLVSDDVAFRIYLGLVYQVVKKNSIGFHFSHRHNAHEFVGFDSLMRLQKDNLFLFRNKVAEFIQLANQVDQVTDTIQLLKRTNVLTVHDAFYDYIDVSLDVMEYAFSIGTLFDASQDFSQYTLLARSANDLYRNIYKQEYTPAINNLVDILEQTKVLIDENRIELPESTIAILDSLGVKVDLASKKEWKKKSLATIDNYISSSSAKPRQVESLQDLKSWYYWNHLDSKLLKISQYGLFMANMANAQTPQEVASILDNATLPVGSSSIKKNSKTNVAIQSYLGPYVLMDKPDNNNAWTSQFGVTAPIGIAFSKGFTHKGGSLSLFVSLLDLGAIVDYQLKAETITTPGGLDTTTIHKDYKVELGQIFSPGTYLVYGLPWRLPLSFGIGGQYGPGLGKIEDDNDVVINNPAWRWNAFIAVDIPLFNLANTPRRN
ncbi:MAG TPA: hypothetical protein VFV79_08915 [Saprospiraceae bacterium]|nr:hypothetical protein [Saprospiraceae bacterium]